MRSTVGILLCLFFSCTGKYPFHKLDDIDQIQIHWKNRGDAVVSTDSITISIFKDVLKGKAKKVADTGCDVDGYVWFMKEKVVMEIASFSVRPAGCIMLIISDGEGGPFNIYSLTYRAGMYLDHLMSKQRGNVRNN